MADLGGMSVEEIVGKSMYEEGRLPPDIQRERVARVEEVFEKREALVFEDESFGMLFEHRLYPVFGAGGEVERVAIFASDVTEKKTCRRGDPQQQGEPAPRSWARRRTWRFCRSWTAPLSSATRPALKRSAGSVEELRDSNVFERFFP